jgi:hypothetical protein
MSLGRWRSEGAPAPSIRAGSDQASAGLALCPTTCLGPVAAGFPAWPWRLGGRWWTGEEHADRYQLVTSVGAFLCVVIGGRVFLAGVYD